MEVKEERKRYYRRQVTGFSSWRIRLGLERRKRLLAWRPTGLRVKCESKGQIVADSVGLRHIQLCSD